MSVFIVEGKSSECLELCPGIKCPVLEVTPVTTAHNALSRTSHVVLLNQKGRSEEVQSFHVFSAARFDEQHYQVHTCFKGQKHSVNYLSKKKNQFLKDLRNH